MPTTRSLCLTGLGLASLTASLVACGGEPSAPYAVSSSPTAAPGSASPSALSSATSAPAPSTSGTAAPFTRASASPASDPRAITLGKAKFSAPAGRVLASTLAVDLDGDGEQDLVAWTTAPDGQKGELVRALAKAPDDVLTVLALPPDVFGQVSGEPCKADVAVQLVGPQTIFLDVTCAGRAQRAPRWLAAVELPKGAPAGGASALKLELRVPARPADEELSVSASMVDRDADGALDLVLSFSLAGSPSPLSGALAVSAPVVWLARSDDKGSVLSRDPREPEASLLRTAKSLTSDAKKSAAGHVPATASALARLRSLLCGSALTGKPAACGPPDSRDEAELATVLAYASKGDVLRAYGAFDQTFGQSGVAAPSARSREAQTQLDKLAPRVSPKEKKLASPVPAATPGLVPLAWDASGALLVKTASGVVKVELASGTETPLGTDTFLRGLELPGGMAVTLVDDRCEGAVVAAVAEREGKHTIALPSLTRSSRGESCLGGATLPPFVHAGTKADGTASLALGTALFELAPGGSTGRTEEGKPGPRVSLAEGLMKAPGAQGSARSPDGQSIALVSSRGVLVVQRDGAKLWSSSIVGAAKWKCTVDDAGKKVACAGAGTSDRAIVVLEAP